MKKVIFVLSLAAVLVIDSTVTNAQQTASSSVETKKPNSDYKPAFEGQTRIAAVTTKTPYEGKVLTESLRRPWGIAALPDGRFIITEKAGVMKIVSAAGAVGESIGGVPKGCQ